MTPPATPHSSTGDAGGRPECRYQLWLKRYYHLWLKRYYESREYPW